MASWIGWPRPRGRHYQPVEWNQLQFQVNAIRGDKPFINVPGPTRPPAATGAAAANRNPKYVSLMDSLPHRRITTNPRQCGGQPCIRGMRICVADVLQLFAAGLTAEQILAVMPDPEAPDLQAALQYALQYTACQLDYPRLAA